MRILIDLKGHGISDIGGLAITGSSRPVGGVWGILMQNPMLAAREDPSSGS